MKNNKKKIGAKEELINSIISATSKYYRNSLSESIRRGMAHKKALLKSEVKK